MHDPHEGLSNWIRICKPGGHVVVLIPDEDMYEQGVWPSAFNTDHKSSFTLYKAESWSPRSVNALDLLRLSTVEILSLKKLHQTYRNFGRMVDQTMTYIGECAIEFVLRKL